MTMHRPLAGLLCLLFLAVAPVSWAATGAETEALTLAREIAVQTRASGYLDTLSPTAILARRGKVMPTTLAPVAQADIIQTSEALHAVLNPAALEAYAALLVESLSLEDLRVLAAYFRSESGQAYTKAMTEMALDPATNLNAPFLPDAAFAMEIAGKAEEAGFKVPDNWQFPAP
jgi:hypothetical protein